MTTNPTTIPEPTSPTAVVVAKLVASPKTGVDCCLWSKAFTGKYSMELGGFKIAPYNEPGPWLRGDELEAVVPTLKAELADEVERLRKERDALLAACKGDTAIHRFG